MQEKPGLEGTDQQRQAQDADESSIPQPSRLDIACDQTSRGSAQAGSSHCDWREHHDTDETLPEGSHRRELARRQREPWKKEPHPNRLSSAPFDDKDCDEPDGKRENNHEAQGHHLKHLAIREHSRPTTNCKSVRESECCARGYDGEVPR